MMEVDDYDDEILPEAMIFESRADNIMKTKMEAYKQSINTIIDEEASKTVENEQNYLLGKIKEKLKRKPRAKKGKAKAEVTPTKEKEVTPPSKVTKRSTRGRAGHGKKAKGITNVEEEPESPVLTKVTLTPTNLPALAKRRLKELELKTSRDTERVDEETRRILSSCNADFSYVPEVTTPTELQSEPNIILKIRYMSEISKMDVNENEKFATIFSKVADLFQLKASEILLCIGDKNVQVDDTPQSLKLKFFDIIDCIPYKAAVDAAPEDNSNKLLIKIQSSDSRKKIDMYTHKLEKFQEIMERYAKLRDIPLRNLTFEFDGDKIDGSETPEDLDMESGSCIDVKVVEEKKRELIIPIIDIQDSIPESEMLQICVLD